MFSNKTCPFPKNTPRSSLPRSRTGLDSWEIGRLRYLKTSTLRWAKKELKRQFLKRSQSEQSLLLCRATLRKSRKTLRKKKNNPQPPKKQIKTTNRQVDLCIIHFFFFCFCILKWYYLAESCCCLLDLRLSSSGALRWIFYGANLGPRCLWPRREHLLPDFRTYQASVGNRGGGGFSNSDLKKLNNMITMNKSNKSFANKS